MDKADEIAMITVREDLTLQCSKGETSFDVALTDKGAFCFTLSLMEALSACKPWRAVPNADLIGFANSLAYHALSLAGDASLGFLDIRNRGPLVIALDNAFCVLALVRQEIEKGNPNGSQH